MKVYLVTHRIFEAMMHAIVARRFKSFGTKLVNALKSGVGGKQS
jgi:hypothetical protein